MGTVSQSEVLVSAALQVLKFESQPDSTGELEGARKHKVTAATVAYVKSLEGKKLVVGADGSVTPE
jgi:hypothetical protein